MRKSKYIGILLSLISVTCMLTGCWDSVEIDNRSMLLEFMVDKNDEYVYDSTLPRDQQKVYRMSYAIPDFGKISGTQSLATDAETNIIIEAPTIANSIDDLEMKSKDSVSFSHIKSIFIGESLLKDRELLKQTIDSLSRDMLVARNTPLLAVNGPATLAGEMENSEQPILGLYVMDHFNNKERSVSFFKEQLLGNFIRRMDETGIATLPVFHVEQVIEAKAEEEAKKAEGNEEGGEGEEKSEGNPMDSGGEDEKGGEDKPKSDPKNEINISGGAVIRDYELVGYLTKEEVRGQLFIEGKIKNAPVTTFYEGGSLTYRIKEQSSKVSFEETEDGPVCTIKIETKGDITEYEGAEGVKLTDLNVADAIKKAIGNAIVEQVKTGITRSKELNTDYLGIGLEMYRQKPDMWRHYQEGWHSGVYYDLPIQIFVTANIQSTGIKE